MMFRLLVFAVIVPLLIVGVTGCGDNAPPANPKVISGGEKLKDVQPSGTKTQAVPQ